MTVLVFIDSDFPAGRIADANQPQLFATDLGATRGDGIFESLLAVENKPKKIQAHLDRLASSATLLELEIPTAEQWRAAIDTALAEFDQPEAVVKLLVTRGVEGAKQATAWVQVSPLPALGKQQRERGLTVILLDRGYDSEVALRAPWLLLGAKTLSYAVNMAALRYAQQHGADDVIFTSADGRVLEGPTSSVLIAKVSEENGSQLKRLITPQLDSGILPGTTQGALFAAAQRAGWQLGYGPLEPKHLYEADAAWLISSVRLLAPINSIDGQQIGEDTQRAELTAELSAILASTE
ncbi:aminodeoxychorismate lyase [Psychromicrobium lacuslunae]|uniref:4-amino-4-deoxychorismate lyase n=1 Tax=Psychromicrobium lacuslunae TaxID=1618207 RepID=A0A0D4C0V6_9MICC|nr:aminodeoxychorismate lyase [Psychromicrobium lacuslunae]AJT42020.1 4-amino-4-deoxychorismate lyase [Psychromicrobium lacuslunae]